MSVRIVIWVDQTGIVCCDGEAKCDPSFRRVRYRAFGKEHIGEATERTSDVAGNGPKFDAEAGAVVGSAAAKYPYRDISPAIDIEYVVRAGADIIGQDCAVGVRYWLVRVQYLVKTDAFPDYEVLVNGGLDADWPSDYSGPNPWNLGSGPEIDRPPGDVLIKVFEPIIAPGVGPCIS